MSKKQRGPFVFLIRMEIDSEEERNREHGSSTHLRHGYSIFEIDVTRSLEKAWLDIG